MSLLDDLRSVLSRHHAYVTEQTQQGTAHLIEAHLNALQGATSDTDAHLVLDHLYRALNAPDGHAPAAAPVIGGAAAAAPLPVDDGNEHPDGAV